MVQDTRGPDALPLLAYTLRELYQQYGGDRRLDLEEYRRLGGVTGAIEKKLEEALAVCSPDELAALRRAFVRQLIRVDEGAVEGERYLRRAVKREDLPEGSTRLIGRLREARLLVDGDDGTISIAHERLIGDWKNVPLRSWLADDSDDRKLIERLKSYLAGHRQGGPLLSDKPLLDARDLLQRDRTLATDEPELAQFVGNSIRAEERRRRRRNWALGGAVAASIVFLAVAAVAVWSFLEGEKQAFEANKARIMAEDALHEQEVSNSKMFAALANAETRRSDGREALTLALNGLQKSLVDIEDWPDTQEAAEALSRAAPKHRFELLNIAVAQADVNSVSYSPDGTNIVIGLDDGTVRVWDVMSGTSLILRPTVR